MKSKMVKVYAHISYYWRCPNCGQEHEWLAYNTNHDGSITCISCFTDYVPDLETEVLK
jgi:formylmethanofuran dehydrogenase subunit E